MEFRRLKDTIFKEAQPKKINGKRLNGPSLAKFMETIIDSINKGSVPDISNAYSFYTLLAI